MQKKLKVIGLSVWLISVSLLASTSRAQNLPKITKKDLVKNVIILIPDGTSITHISYSRWFNGGQPLALDEIACGLVRTYPADSFITDSAPAATAMATGFKSKDKYIGIISDKNTMWGLEPIPAGEEERPMATILEAARLSGRATGLVSTSQIQHATPASYSAHVPHRENYEEIGEQQIYNGLDVILGGGSDYLQKANRKDKEDMISELKNKGFTFLTTRDELLNFKGNKLWGAFAGIDMHYDIDRLPTEPTLAEMSQKAIDTLSQNKKGFFLMIEGSKIDWASHGNDPVGIASDVLSFDKAVKVALDFAKKNKNTVVLVAPDHGNGGFSIGSKLSDKDYPNAPISKFINVAKKAKHSAEWVMTEISKDENKNNPEKVITIIKENYVADLTEADIAKIKETPVKKMMPIIVQLISARDAISFTTNGHTGEDVNLFAYHPTGYRPTGLIQNTDIPKYFARVMQLDLAKSTDILFQEAGTEFKKVGAEFKIDVVSAVDENDVVLEAKKGNSILKMPVNKNFGEYNGKKIFFSGVTVYNSRTKKAYVSTDALKLFK